MARARNVGSRTEPLDAQTKHLAEGEAALVLMESLLLTLVDKGVVGRDELVQSIESLVDMKRQMAADGVAPGLSTIAAGILIKIANTLAAEGDGAEIQAAASKPVALRSPQSVP